ncbi:YhcH/YjgK/YiaL family protein [Cohnella boryungensis]|uniref:YhcH/YjgK/YiaL family protein n=1 Tax=Cohnella boryungensis TaxID=768479 RepID=A0ABV8SHR6_9BACL
MIFGDRGMLTAGELRALHPVLREALLKLAGTDLQALSPGKHEWDGERVFLLLQEMETAPKAEKKLESHRRYLDIQWLIEGEERIGYTRKSASHAVCEDELANKDYALYDDPADEMELTMKPGTFAIFFPEDLHRPGVCGEAPARIKKAVVKVDLELLAN